MEFNWNKHRTEETYTARLFSSHQTKEEMKQIEEITHMSRNQWDVI